MKPQYVTPRLAVVLLTSEQEAAALLKGAQSRHQNYYHCFNLSTVSLGDRESAFKWRGFPFSLTEALRMLTQIDTFLRANCANSALVCAGCPSSLLFSRLLLASYLHLCALSIRPHSQSATDKLLALSEKTASSHPLFRSAMAVLYNSVRVELPPLKILEALWL